MDWLDKQDESKRRDLLEALMAEATALGVHADTVVESAGRNYANARHMPAVYNLILAKGIHTQPT